MFLIPFQVFAQINIAGKRLQNDKANNLSKIFKQYRLFSINQAELFRSAKTKGKGKFNVSLQLEEASSFTMEIEETSVLASNYTLYIGNANGKELAPAPVCKTYSGKVVDDTLSAISLTISDKTIYGFIRSKGKQFHIEPLRYYDKNAAVGNYVLYEAADVNAVSDLSCGVNEATQRVAQMEAGTPQQNDATGICKVVDFAIASDKTMVDKLGSPSMVEEHNISVMNMMIGLYRNAQIGTGYLGFRITTQYISTSQAADPLSPLYNGRDVDTLLVNFAAWSIQKSFANQSDLGQMWTARDFGQKTGPLPTDYNYSTIGLAYVGAACKSQSKFQVLEDFSSVSGMSLGVLAAHETGHNLGALHDATSGYIMAASLDGNATQFSAESLLAMATYTTSLSCFATCQVVGPIVQFNPSSTRICTGSSVKFTNATVSDIPLSLGSYWQFPGGTPAVSTDVSPTVTYATPGKKLATLTFGTSSVTKEIFVGNAPGAACRTLLAPDNSYSSLMKFSLASIAYSPSTVYINGVYDNLVCSQNTELQLGSTYLVTASLGFPNLAGSDSYLQVFIDYNNDGDFADANEKVYTGSQCKTGIDSFYFTTPAFVSNVDRWLRLRVIALGCKMASTDGCTIPGNAAVVDFGVVFKAPPPCILYVNASAAGTNDGSSWINAFTRLQDAINAVSCPYFTQIWVAKGTYKPTSGTNRDSAFVMKNKVAIYGGFAGNEKLLSSRNWSINTTILSGDIGVQNNNVDNSYHLVLNYLNGLDSTAILDGFTIRDGNAYKGEYVGNRGGAINNINSSPFISNCIFTSNNAAEYGGAVFNQDCNPKLVNCVFAGNYAWYGGGLYNESASTQLVNCTFSGNQVLYTGAAMYTYGAVSPKLTNCVIWGNSSGIQNAGNATPVVNYSVVQGGYAGTGNLNTDPFFVLQSAPGLGNFGNLRLRTICSPAVNAGTNTVWPGDVTSFDLDRGVRINRATVDMGAYEFPGNGDIIVFVDSAATGSKTGYDWANAFTSLSDVLKDLNLCSPVNTYIFIAKGTYTVPANTKLSIAVNNVTVWGGYPSGGGGLKYPAQYPVIIKGDVEVLKPARIDGVVIQKQ